MSNVPEHKPKVAKEAPPFRPHGSPPAQVPDVHSANPSAQQEGSSFGPPSSGSQNPAPQNPAPQNPEALDPGGQDNSCEAPPVAPPSASHRMADHAAPTQPAARGGVARDERSPDSRSKTNADELGANPPTGGVDESGSSFLSDGQVANRHELADADVPKASLVNRITIALVNYWDTRRTPAFLVSLIVHIAALLILALLAARQRWGPEGETHELVAGTAQKPVQQPEFQLSGAADAPPPTASDPLISPANQSDASQRPNRSLSELLKIQEPEPPSESATSVATLLDVTSQNWNASFSSTGVEGRQLDRRQQVALANGGTLETEQAVEDALDWLAAHQRPSGAWSLIHDQGRCNGRCRNNGSEDRFDTAATGLSLLAFLGAGYTHIDGKHRETVRKGVYFLLQVMEESPEGGSFLYQCDRGMYNHGIAAFALCEAYQLTKDKALRRPAQLAIDFIVSSQNYRGGWGYLPKKPGDLTLSGWQIMALKSGFAAGLDIPPSAIMRIDGFLDSQQAESGVFFGYGKPGRSPTCSSIGLLIRLFRGMSHTDPRVLEGAAYFQRVGRSNGDAYFNYYVTLFLFHMGQPFWEPWNESMRAHLVKTQSRTGHEAGSWYFENPYGKEGGRLYTTAMCAMTLEVYYRFSPLYQQAEQPFEL